MKLHELTKYIDEYLKINECPDNSLNGLQIEGRTDVQTIALAVDACTETFSKAAALKADMLLVHHGIFWGKPFALTGIHAKRIRNLIESNISLYAAHLPLDIHPEVGNNAGFIKNIGFTIDEPCGDYKSIKVGYKAHTEKAITLDEISQTVKSQLGVEPIVYSFSSNDIKSIAVISGDGASLVEEMSGTDLFITGEISHASYHFAKEMGVNLMFAGHYAMETIGVKLLGKKIEKDLSLNTVFIDIPTGM